MPMSILRSPSLFSSDHAPWVLRERMVMLGRGSDCGVHLEGSGIEDKHAYILFREGEFWLRSLHAQNPVRINGEPATAETVLHPGDQLQIGTWQLTFQEGAAEEADHPQENKDPFFQTMVDLLESPDTAETSRRLVQSVARLMKCDAVALVQLDASDTIHVLASFPVQASISRFSHSALEQAREAGQTLLLFPAESGQDPSRSIAENNISSLLCAPLLEHGEVLGFLYMDRIAGHTPFHEEDRASFETLRRLFSLILEKSRRLEHQSRLLETMQQQESLQQGILGESTVLRDALEQARAVAKTHASVFIHGETGTGKELFARFIHQNSPVAQGPFIAINCGAIAPNLIESELFGYEKGAFTGANESRVGWVEKANGGTLFLDELGELDLNLQTRLLRVLQEGEVMKVGGREPRQVDFRLVSASHRDLRELIRSGQFREDLFYRVHVLGIELPALRERGQDALLLANYFLQRVAAQQGTAGYSLGRKAERAVLTHSWPGNIRELQNAIQRAVILCKSKTILPADLGLVSRAEELEPEEGALQTLQEAREEAERQVCDQALIRTRGNVSQAAKLLDIDRKALGRILERISVSPDDYK